MSSLPSFVPPSHTGDISVTGPLSSVAPSTRSGVQEPSEVVEPVVEAPKPRLLKRRARESSREPFAPTSSTPEPPAPFVPTNAEASVEPLKEESVIEPPRRVSESVLVYKFMFLSIPCSYSNVASKQPLLQRSLDLMNPQHLSIQH